MTTPSEPKFCLTHIADRVMDRLAMTHRANLIASIQGPPGIGKTTAVLRYAEERPRRVWYYAARQDTAAKGPFFRDLAGRLMGFKDIKTDENVGSIIMAARDRAGEGKVPLLIVDEAQVLKSDTFETLRSIHDEGVLALAFVGNHTFTDRHNKERIALTVSPQFRSRIGLEVDLDTIEPNDAAEIARKYGFPEPLIGRVSKVAGGVRGLRIIGDVARLANEAAGHFPPTPGQFEAAFKILCS